MPTSGESPAAFANRRGGGCRLKRKVSDHGQPTFGPPIRFEAPTPQGAVDYPGSSGGRIGAGKNKNCAFAKKKHQCQERGFNPLASKARAPPFNDDKRPHSYRPT